MKNSMPLTLPWARSLLSLKWLFDVNLLSASRYEWGFCSSKTWRLVITQKCGFPTLIHKLVFNVCRNSKIIHVAFYRHTVILRVTRKAQSILWLGYGMENWGAVIWFPAAAGRFCLLQSIHTGSGAHVASRGKGTRVGGWPLTLHLLQRLRLHGAILQFPICLNGVSTAIVVYIVT